MNTEFFEKASDIEMDFTWKDIFSDVFKPHTKDDKNRLLTRGLTKHDISRAKMLEEWQKPWMFFRVAVIVILISILSMALGSFSSPSVLPMIIMIPAWAVPLAVLVFFWEMNIPGNVSIFEIILYMITGGIASILIYFFITYFVEFAPLACISAPLPEELCKFIMVWILLSRKDYKYGVQGIMIGACVGAGFSAIETAMYAFNTFLTVFTAGGGLSIITKSVIQVQIVRGLLAVGGHVIWAALYGGALALAKGKGKMRANLILDPLVLMAFSAAFLLHTMWNFIGGIGDESEIVYFLDAYSQEVVVFINKLSVFYIPYIIAIVLAWALMLMILRKSIRQCVSVSNQARKRYQAAGHMPAPAQVQPQEAARNVGRTVLTVQATGELNVGKEYRLTEGESLIFGRDPSRANVLVPESTRGISKIHCEIKMKDGWPVLIDRQSSYGTFMANGQKLEPNVPYKIKGTVTFYLAAEKNKFTIHLQ
ncbi:MAG: PrsW family glutamic-type intramembrane protease [Oliverpabstia sp.]